MVGWAYHSHVTSGHFFPTVLVLYFIGFIYTYNVLITLTPLFHFPSTPVILPPYRSLYHIHAFFSFVTCLEPMWWTERTSSYKLSLYLYMWTVVFVCCQCEQLCLALILVGLLQVFLHFAWCWLWTCHIQHLKLSCFKSSVKIGFKMRLQNCKIIFVTV